MKQLDMPRYLFAGALSGGITGTVDAVVASVGAGHGMSALALVISLVFSGMVLLPVGILIGTTFYAFSLILPTGATVRQALIRLRTPRNAMVFTLLLFGGIATVITAGYKRGIMVDALNFRPLIFSATFVVLFWTGRRFLRPFPKESAVGAILTLSVSLALLTMLASRIGAAKEVLSVLGAETTFVKYTIAGIKKGFDRDGDGFATVLCGADCDCDDKNPSRNPGQLDIPGNGIDEDCSGDDLTTGANDASGVAKTNAAKLPPGAPFNILLITIDTLRADRMHMYGYHRETTPNLDRFAKDSVLFKQVRSQGPSTRHVFPVLLTGRYFSTIALKKEKKWSKLLPSNKTFAEYLKAHGYQTMAVLPYFRFKEHSGFQQGFDNWETTFTEGRNATWDPTGDLVTNRGIELLQTLVKSDKPWLLWLHYFDPHASYVKHEGMPEFGTSRADRYDGEIQYVDYHIKRFLEEFAKLGDPLRTATIVTADHGEGIGLETDHGFNYHGFSLFDSETRIPLMIRVPGFSPRVVEECVGLIDVPPTILVLAGIIPPRTLHGVSLIPYLSDNPPKRAPFLMQLPEKTPEEAIMDWPYKLIWRVKSNQYGLYHLKNDPHEQNNLANVETDTTERLKKQLKLELYRLNREGFGAGDD